MSEEHEDMIECVECGWVGTPDELLYDDLQNTFKLCPKCWGVEFEDLDTEEE